MSDGTIVSVGHALFRVGESCRTRRERESRVRSYSANAAPQSSLTHALGSSFAAANVINGASERASWRGTVGRARGDPPLTKAAIDDAGAAQTSPSSVRSRDDEMLSFALAAASQSSHFLSPLIRPISGIIKDGMVTSLQLIHSHTFPKQIHNQNLLPGLQPRPSVRSPATAVHCLQQTRFGRGPRTVILGRGGEAP